MNIATLDYTSLSADLHALPNCIPSDPKRSIRYSLASLRSHRQPDLPLLVDVSSTMQANFVVYNCILTSMTSKKTWTVSYRYSEFDTFRTKIEEEWTCHESNCSGSCQALRDIISAYFPKKRLSIMSSNQGAITSRKRKFELVVIHLLRSVLLPGSAMKCIHARQNLPDHVFEFLGVKDADDRRSVLQIFVDDYQTDATEKKDQSSANPTLNAVQCTVCLNNLEFDSDGTETDNSDDEDTSKNMSDSSESDKSQVVLPCKHSFHRQCIFEWLLFEFHCPVCRISVFPNAVTSYCRSSHRYLQWWLSESEK